MADSQILKLPYTLDSRYLKRAVELEIFMPENLLGNGKLNLLLFNDGQDAEALQLQDTLSQLYNKGKIEALAIVAIKASKDRLDEYGVAGRPDYMGRGSQAKAYTKFVVKELMPFLEDTISLPINGSKAFAGCSLGGLSAFDVAWNNPGVFNAVGVFSGSFWWRQKDLKDGYTDNDRIAHQLVRETDAKRALKFWLMTGTEDEKTDRNHNFIIDSIDDTVDLIKELVKKGYNRPQDISYFEMVGGRHNTHTWAKALPAFLVWAFARKLTL